MYAEIWKRLGLGYDRAKPSIWEHLLRIKRIVVEIRRRCLLQYWRTVQRGKVQTTEAEFRRNRRQTEKVGRGKVDEWVAMVYIQLRRCGQFNRRLSVRSITIMTSVRLCYATIASDASRFRYRSQNLFVPTSKCTRPLGKVTDR